MSVDTYTFKLSKELQEKAEKELNEKEEWRHRDIRALRERVLNNKALTCRTDPAFLLMFLRARKFDYERSYKLLENYFKIRAEYAEHFKDMTPSALAHVFDAGIGQVLPKPDKYGRRIFYYRLGRWDPAKVTLHEILKAIILSVELCLKEDEASQINGFVALDNFEGLSWEHARNLDRAYYKLESAIIQDGIPVRAKGFYVCNEPSVFTYVFSLIKPFMKAKMASRVFMFGTDLERLKIDTGLTPDLLPAELGGTLPHGDQLAKQWKERVLSHEQYFVDQLQYKLVLPRNISSSARPAEELNEISGISGTFKKLNVD